jgi:hypothetical protein
MADSRSRTRRKARSESRQTGGEENTPRSPTLAFAVEQLRNDPKITFGELREAGRKSGFKVEPIVYGRAKLYLGLAKPRLPNSPVLFRRGPGRPPKSGDTGAIVRSLAGLAEAARREAAYRKALLKIRSILDNIRA